MITLGVEEELMILDGETYEPVSASHLLVGELDVGILKTELHASVIEATTPICHDVVETVASRFELDEYALLEPAALAAKLVRRHHKVHDDACCIAVKVAITGVA